MKALRFCEDNKLYETYSSEDYDRKNYDIPSYQIQSNVSNGREWLRKFIKIQQDLDFFRKTEMKMAYENCLTNLENIKMSVSNINYGTI
jgi:hypothetical protein